MKKVYNDNDKPQVFDDHLAYMKAYWHKVCLIADKRLGGKKNTSSVKPEDVAFEVFKIAEQKDMWCDSKKDHRAWLTTCTSNKVIDMVHRPAKNKKNRDASLTTDSIDTTESRGNDESTCYEHPAFTKVAKQRFDDLERKKDNLEILFRFLNTLPELNRNLAYLVEAGGFSVEQAAQSLSINYTRALKMIKDFRVKSKDYFRRNGLLGMAPWITDLPDMTLYLQI